MGFQAHPSPYPKRRLNRFGRFCTPYHFTQPPNSYGLHLTTIFNKPRTLLKSAPCFCGIWTPTNARFFGITLHIDLAYRLTGRNMQKQWQSRNKTKLYLRRVFVLPIMLYGSECWAINKADIQRIDAVDQWCLRRILDIRWHDPLSEMPASVALLTSHHFHPSLSPVVSLSSGILHEWMRTQMLAKPSSNLFQGTGGDHWDPRSTRMKNIHDDLSSLDIGMHEARDLAHS